MTEEAMRAPIFLRRLAALRALPFRFGLVVVELWHEPELSAIYRALAEKRTAEARQLLADLEPKIGTTHPECARVAALISRLEILGR